MTTMELGLAWIDIAMGPGRLLSEHYYFLLFFFKDLCPFLVLLFLLLLLSRHDTTLQRPWRGSRMGWEHTKRGDP
jgi:hypothetical protein